MITAQEVSGLNPDKVTRRDKPRQIARVLLFMDYAKLVLVKAYKQQNQILQKNRGLALGIWNAKDQRNRVIDSAGFRTGRLALNPDKVT